MKIDNAVTEEIAEMEAKVAAKREALITDIVLFVEVNGIDKKALCAALLPKRTRAGRPAKADDPVTDQQEAQ